MSTLLTAAATLTIAAVMRLAGWSTRLVALSAIVVVLGLLPDYTGRAPSGPTLVQAVVVVVGVVALFAEGFRSYLWVFVGLLAYVLVGGTLAWQDAGGMWQGIWSLSLVSFAFVAGSYAGRGQSDDAHGRRLATLLLFVVVVETVVTALQLAGVEVFGASGRTAELTEGRATGTFGHPGTVGKVLLLLDMLLLPLTLSADRRTRRYAVWASMLSLLPVALSGSRANLAALLMLLLLWSAFIPGRAGAWRRMGIPVAVLLGAAAWAGPTIARFAEDPEGQVRLHFVEVALAQIQRAPWVGVGPTNYVAAAGQFDSLTAQGWPVHNVFLLAVAELGIIGAVLLAAGVLVALLRAFACWRRRDARGLYARALVLGLLALGVPIGLTGWGMLNDHLLYLMFGVVGYLFASMHGNALRTADEAFAPALTIQKTT